MADPKEEVKEVDFRLEVRLIDGTIVEPQECPRCGGYHLYNTGGRPFGVTFTNPYEHVRTFILIDEEPAEIPDAMELQTEHLPGDRIELSAEVLTAIGLFGEGDEPPSVLDVEFYRSAPAILRERARREVVEAVFNYARVVGNPLTSARPIVEQIEQGAVPLDAVHIVFGDDAAIAEITKDAAEIHELLRGGRPDQRVSAEREPPWGYGYED